MSVIWLVLSYHPYLRSAMVRFSLGYVQPRLYLVFGWKSQFFFLTKKPCLLLLWTNMIMRVCYNGQSTFLCLDGDGLKWVSLAVRYLDKPWRRTVPLYWKLCTAICTENCDLLLALKYDRQTHWQSDRPTYTQLDI